MASFLVYLLATGVIDRTGSVPDGNELMQATFGEEVMIGQGPNVTGETHYVDLGPPLVLTAKAAMPVTIDKTYVNTTGSDIAAVSGVPPGVLAYVDGVLVDGNVADGSIEFTADTLGIYVMRLEHVRYLAQEFRIRAGVIEAPLISTSTRVLPVCCTPSPIRDSVVFLTTS